MDGRAVAREGRVESAPAPISGKSGAGRGQGVLETARAVVHAVVVRDGHGIDAGLLDHLEGAGGRPEGELLGRLATRRW